MDKINNWFNCTHYGPSPHDFVVDVLNTFCRDVKDRNMTLCVSKQQMYSILCEGMCVLYDQYMNYEDKHLTIANTSHFEYPPGWSQEIETIWIDFLSSRIFDEDYWEMFWEKIGESELESEVHNWRSEFQTLLPYYITRSLHTLVTAGLVDPEDDECSTENVSEPDNDDYSK